MKLTPYDLVIRGGTVIDPSTDSSAVADIAVVDGRIADIGPALSGEARETGDARGDFVVPGLVDFHVHV